MIRGLCELIVWMHDMAAIYGNATIIAASMLVCVLWAAIVELVSVLWAAIVKLVGRSVKR